MGNTNKMMICIPKLRAGQYCSYSIRITIETFTNLKQILEKKPWEKRIAKNLKIQF